MIDKKWMRSYAEKVTKCPGCGQKSFCLIFVSEDGHKVWECAESECLHVEN